MQGKRGIVAAVIVVVVVLIAWLLLRRSGEGTTIRFADRLEEARKQPDPALYSVTDATLNGETKRAIAVAPATGTRLTWRAKVPDDGWLSVAVGLKPEAWTQEGNGVLFFVGVSAGGSFEMLFTQHVDPFNNPGDRKWIPVMVDLAAYEGDEVELIFNTRGGKTGTEGDTRADLALWGQPEIVQR